MTKYLILDTARCNSYTIQVFKNAFGENISLFYHTRDENLDDVAPYLFKIDEVSLREILDSNRHINFSSYLFVHSNASLSELFSHFQKFIYKTKDGREYFFRFYDPFVLRRFLADYNQHDLLSFFGPVSAFVMSDDQSFRLLEFSVKKGILQTHIKESNEYSANHEIKLKPSGKSKTENIHLSS